MKINDIFSKNVFANTEIVISERIFSSLPKILKESHSDSFFMDPDNNIHILLENQNQYQSLLDHLSAHEFLIINNGNEYRVSGDFAEKV